MKKRLIAWLLVLSTLLGLLPGCGNDNNDPSNGEATENIPQGQGPGPEQLSSPAHYITRGEWIGLLAQDMGMDEYLGESAYYTDISASSELYPYVQSSYEWGVLALETDSAFRPDEMATREFVAITAILSIGELSVEEGAAKDEILANATANGVVESSDWSGGVKIMEALNALEVTKKLYISLAEAEIIDVTFLDDILDLTGNADGQIVVSGSQVTMPAEMAANLDVGSVFIGPATAENPYGVAMKVTSVNGDGEYVYLETEEPDLGEVFDEINLHATGVPDADNIVVSEGVTLSSVTPADLSGTGHMGQITSLSSRSSKTSEIQAKPMAKGLSAELTVNFTKGTVSVKPGWDDNSVSVERLIPPELRAAGDIGMSPDLGKLFERSLFTAKSIPIKDVNGNVMVDKDGLEQVIQVSDKFSGSYEVTGTVALSDIYVTATVEFKKFWGIPTGLKRVVIELNYEASASLNFKGEIGEEISLAFMPIPIGGGFSVNAEFVLHFNAEGEVSVSAKIGKNVKFEYSDGNIKKTQTGTQSVTGEFAVKAETGVGFKATLEALGIDVIDAEISALVELNVKSGLKYAEEEKREVSGTTETITTTQKVFIYLTTQASAPVVKLSVGTKETLANKLNIKGTWTLLSAENAPLQWKPEWANKEWPLIELPTVETRELEPSEIESENPDGENGDNDDNASNNPYATLVIDQIMLTMDPGDVELLTFASFPTGESQADLSFATGDPNVAMVNRYGYITAVGGGSTQIFVETASGAVQSCVVTVSGDIVNDFTPDDFL